MTTATPQREPPLLPPGLKRLGGVLLFLFVAGMFAMMAGPTLSSDANAEILSLQDTKDRVNENPVVRLSVRVEAEGLEPYTAQIVTPISPRCFEHQRRFYLGTSVLAFIPLGREARLLPEATMWTFVGERLGQEGTLDVGVPKARAEYLLHGHAFAPGGAPASGVPVSARVGPSAKQLWVSGDRY